MVATDQVLRETYDPVGRLSFTVTCSGRAARENDAEVGDRTLVFLP